MDNDLTNLARAIVAGDTVNQKAITSLLDSLSPQQLRVLLSALRTAYEKIAVTVTTATDTNMAEKNELENTFKQTIRYHVDPTVGAGVIVKIGDDVYDYTVLNYIENTVTQLQEEL